MAIVSVTRVWHGETWSDEKDGSREYEELYRVISDDSNEPALAVRTAAGLPLPWASYPDDIAAICTGRTARRIDASRLVWEVTVKYEWKPEDDDEEDPLDRDPKIRWTSNTVMVPAIKDRDGDAIVNSAGDYYDPPPEIPKERWIANIQFNATTIPTNLRQYKGAVNESPVTIDGEPVAAERAKIVGLDIGELDFWGEDRVPFRSITMAVEVRDDDDESYDLEMLDQGFRIKDPDTDELKDIMVEPDGGGVSQRASAPVLLDGDGQKLDDPSPETAVFITYDIANLRDISIFPGIEG